MQSGLREPVGKTIRQLVPQAAEEWILTCDAVLGTGESIRFERELVAVGRVHVVERSLGWTYSHAIPLLDAAGEIVEWFGTASDVTEHKRAEQALRESEDRYRNLFNSMDQG